MSTTWPGETEIVDRWNYDNGEAPTLEFTREFPRSSPMGIAICDNSLPEEIVTGVRASIVPADTWTERWIWKVEVFQYGSWRTAHRAFCYESLISSCRSRKKAMRKATKWGNLMTQKMDKQHERTYGVNFNVEVR